MAGCDGPLRIVGGTAYSVPPIVGGISSSLDGS